jgi:HEPN domain-containing protein
VDFIDTTIFGSLFRFNRRYYNFNDVVKTEGFRNLRELHDKIQPVMLRRRKDEIEEQLPERIDNNYFVEMTKEQRVRYTEFESQVSRLMVIARGRQLRPEEHERLQKLLACMRMLCDSCYILDDKITDSPKVDELSRILDDIWENDPERKVIIFSEWVRMLELTRALLEKKSVDYSWHVGSVPQDKRREEINKFKNNPDCKVFLSSDSGGLGLNLQAASVVVNMDLPWNPAKLEQRVARAWRKHQKNSVNVINLVAEKTIEHKMIATLGFKQSLADGVLDGRGDIESIEKPDARNAFIERLAELMDANIAVSGGRIKPAPEMDSGETSSEMFEREIILDAGESTKLCAPIKDAETDGIKGVFAVSDDPERTTARLTDIAAKSKTKISENDITVIDEKTYKLLQSLAEQGLITINDAIANAVFKVESLTKRNPDASKRKVKMAREILARSERKLKMAKVLRSGGFEEESVPPARESVAICAKALVVLSSEEPPNEIPYTFDLSSLDDMTAEFSLGNEFALLMKDCVASETAPQNIDYIEESEKLLEEANAIANKISLSVN